MNDPMQTELNYHEGAETEQAGARKASERAESVRFWIVKTLRDKPMTDEEMGFEYQKQFGKPVAIDFFGNTLRRRRHELKKAGIVADTGERRESRSKLKNIVWGLANAKV